jgi:tetratricopeptide (TPR) repeat protein
MADAAEPDPQSTSADAALFARVVELLRQRRRHRGQALPEAPLREAAADLEAYLAARPDSVPALRLAAEVALQLGRPRRSRALIRRAELREPWNAEILIIAEALADLQPDGAPDRSSGASLGLGDESLTTEQLIERAMGAFRLGRLERAYTLAKLAFLLEPRKSHHLLDVWAVGAALDPERTRRELLALQTERGDEAYLMLALGSIGNVLGAYDEAAAWLERGLALEPDDAYATAMLANELAYVWVRAGRHLSRAVGLARRALERFPDRQANGFIRDTLGLAYLKLGQPDKALANLREAVAKDQTVIPRLHLAMALLGRRQAGDALAELRQVAAARPSLESPHIEETLIINRVQQHLGRLEVLLNLGGADDVRDALSILEGLA